MKQQLEENHVSQRPGTENFKEEVPKYFREVGAREAGSRLGKAFLV